MPETVAAWIASSTLTYTSVLTYSQIVALTYTAFAAATLGYGEHQRKKRTRAARNAFNAGLQDRLVMTTTAQAPRSRVYGRARNVDGVVFKSTHGPNKQFYTLVVALAGHQVDAVEQVWFNDQPVTLDAAGYVQTEPWLVMTRETAVTTMTVTAGAGSVVLGHVPAPGTQVLALYEGPTDESGSPSIALTQTGAVTDNTFSITGAPYNGEWKVAYQHEVGVSKARVRAYTGAPGQNLYADLQALVGDAVEPTDRFAGIAALLITLEYDQDAFATGVPSASAVMRGARVYDPRFSITAWTENPALIALDWSLYSHGGACAVHELNASSFLAAANACDVSTTFSTPAGPQTRPLYQCGMVIPLDANPDEALGEICEAMAGQWGWSGGRLSVRAGVYRAPVATITEDWLSGAEEIQVQANVGIAEAVNVLRPTFADAAQGYIPAPAAEVRAQPYIDADGRELAEELELGGVTHAVHAQHVCGVLMRERRESLTVRLPCNLRAYPLELFDVVQVTLPRFGWAAKLFEVLGWHFSATGGVVLALRETAAAVYTPDTSFALLTTSPNSALPRPTRPAPLEGLAVTSGTVAQVDGSSLARLRLSWAPIADAAVRQSGRVEIQVVEVGADANASDWPTAPGAPGSATSADIYGLRIGRGHVVRARAVNTLGMRSPWRQVVHIVDGRRAPITWRQPTPPTGPTVQDGDDWLDTDDGNKPYLRVAGAWVDVRDAGSIGPPGPEGPPAQSMRLAATALAFALDTEGAFNPASQTITIDAVLSNVTGTVAFTATRYDAANASLGTVTLGGSGNTGRTLTQAQFGAAARCVVQATIGSLSDIITILRNVTGPPAEGPTPNMGNRFVGALSQVSGTTTVRAGFEFARDGRLFQYATDFAGNVISTLVGNWYAPTGATVGDAFDITVSLLAGGTATYAGAALNTVLPINTSRAFEATWTGSVVFNRQLQAVYTIRRTATGQQVHSGVLTMQVELDAS